MSFVVSLSCTILICFWRAEAAVSAGEVVMHTVEVSYMEVTESLFILAACLPLSFRFRFLDLQ